MAWCLVRAQGQLCLYLYLYHAMNGGEWSASRPDRFTPPCVSNQQKVVVVVMCHIHDQHFRSDCDPWDALSLRLLEEDYEI
jgi:hypothetical protein